MGNPSRPTPALLNAVYLWGVHLAPQNPGIYDEYSLLRSTLHHLSKDLSSSHPHKVIHTIQAEILVSYYYFKNGKLLEGNYHANAALSLSLSIGLNELPTFDGCPLFSTSSKTATKAIPPPTDAIEEGESVDAFLAVLALNNYWVAIQESHSMFFNPLDAGINTPLPMDSFSHNFVCFSIVSK
jgi:hypothetical protein